MTHKPLWWIRMPAPKTLNRKGSKWSSIKLKKDYQRLLTNYYMEHPERWDVPEVQKGEVRYVLMRLFSPQPFDETNLRLTIKPLEDCFTRARRKRVGEAEIIQDIGSFPALLYDDDPKHCRHFYEPRPGELGKSRVLEIEIWRPTELLRLFREDRAFASRVFGVSENQVASLWEPEE